MERKYPTTRRVLALEVMEKETQQSEDLVIDVAFEILLTPPYQGQSCFQRGTDLVTEQKAATSGQNKQKGSGNGLSERA